MSTEATTKKSRRARPYPACLAKNFAPGTEGATAEAERIVRTPHLHVIDPKHRRVVVGCSRHCWTCERLTRNGGGCPGLACGRMTLPPICHVPMPTGEEALR